MKTTNFVRHLVLYRCNLIREGGSHSIYQNALNKKISSLPRHKEVKNNLVRKICKDLEIPLPASLQ
jgi:predicted RNA binding protein YcfA (HicA-like mRNA interferase family)